LSAVYFQANGSSKKTSGLISTGTVKHLLLKKDFHVYCHSTAMVITLEHHSPICFDFRALEGKVTKDVQACGNPRFAAL
jgi:hypothetical protein